MFFSSLFIWINAFTSPEIVPGSHKAMRHKLKLKKLSLTLHSSSSIVTRCLRVVCCCCRSTSKVVPGGGGEVIIQHIKSKKSNEAWADTITQSNNNMTRSRSTTMIGKYSYKSEESVHRVMEHCRLILLLLSTMFFFFKFESLLCHYTRL